MSKHPRPRSYQVGPYVVREDAGQFRTARVFRDGVEVFAHADLAVARKFAALRWLGRGAAGLYLRQLEREEVK